MYGSRVRVETKVLAKISDCTTWQSQRKSLQEGAALRLPVLFPFLPYFKSKGLSDSS